MNAARLKLGFHNSSSFEPALGGTNALWATAKNSEKAGIPGSLGSINMLDSDSQETSSDDDDQLDHDDSEDPIVTTPQVYKLSTYGLPSSTTSNFASTVSASPGGEWMKENSAFAASLMSFQRARLGNRKLRKKSSCASVGGGSSLASLNLASQPPFRSAETMNGSFFTKDLKNHCYTSRRESLSTGTKELHISSGGDESDENRVTAKLDGSSKSSQPGRDEKKGVIRRVVTRRGNMLPKSKNFARIRAALIEETSIIDTETRHEAEAIRQIRDSDSALDSGLFKSSQHSTIEQSPALLPTEPVPTLFEDISSNEALPGGSSLTRNQEVIHTNFSQQALQNSGGKVFWDSFDARTSTPPPQSIQQRKSSAFSEDIIMGSPSLATTRSSISSATFNGNINSNQFQSSAFDLSRKVTKKRQRDNDLDPSSFKRRAVSPGVSLQNSPILAQSPGQKDGGWWGFQAGFEGGQPSSCFQPLGDRNNFATGVVGASSNSGSKRVGFQGISDTNSGLMNMSIE
ncbi:MAG: hypothetical protein M1829_000380 [Trizodia sp. TS-e1964]|nr:MAG: hypothetical protein M1829_000380 [Trizodia sp. TS-e1964]